MTCLLHQTKEVAQMRKLIIGALAALSLTAVPAAAQAAAAPGTSGYAYITVSNSVCPAFQKVTYIWQATVIPGPGGAYSAEGNTVRVRVFLNEVETQFGEDTEFEAIVYCKNPSWLRDLERFPGEWREVGGFDFYPAYNNQRFTVTQNSLD
jgi:hypothetical protein